MKKMYMMVGISIASVLIFIFLLLTVSLIIQFGRFKKDLKTMTIDAVDITQVKEGVYEGECDLKFVTAKVAVYVADQKITAIDVLQHIHGPKPQYDGRKMTDKIIAEQSLKADAISGATASSKVIIKAVETALKKGL